MSDNWHLAAGNPPPPVGDCRKLVWIVEESGMAWVGIRAYNHAEMTWMVNSQLREESALIKYWMDLPEPPSGEEKP